MISITQQKKRDHQMVQYEMARMVENKDTCRIFVGKPARKRLLGRFRRRWEDKSKKYVSSRNEMGGCGLDFSDFGQGRLAGCCDHGDEHSCFAKIQTIS